MAYMDYMDPDARAIHIRPLNFMHWRLSNSTIEDIHETEKYQ